MLARASLIVVVLVLTVWVAGAAQAATGPGLAEPRPARAPAVILADHVADELLVRFRPGVGAQRVDQLLAARGLTRLRRVPAVGVDVVRLPPGLSVEQAIDHYGRLPEVEFAEPNYVVRAGVISEPVAQWALDKIEAPAAWEVTEGDPSVIIAVVDTGVDYRHPDLDDNMYAAPGEIAGNGLDDNGDGYVDNLHGWDFANNDGDPLDDNNHGTHVAGIAAAEANGVGGAGVCPRCRLMAVKVLGADGTGTMDRVANGISYAWQQGAKVINLSLGAAAGTATLEQAVNNAWAAGAVVVAAAGNDGADTRFYPAAYANAVAVASTTTNDERSCFSNYGDNYVEVGAPGEGIYSTITNGTYAVYSGTSMATPHVAGLAGLLFARAVLPGQSALTNADVVEAIKASVNDLGLQGFDAAFGAGRINANRALHDVRTPTEPAPGLYIPDLGTAYANGRKLARDAGGTLHQVWHTYEQGQYRVWWGTSTDDGATWLTAPIFASASPTYMPALALDDTYLGVAFATLEGADKYQVRFMRRPLTGGAWSPPTALLGGADTAVRPTLHYDPTAQRWHLAASSFDDAPYAYYRASDDAGATWGPTRQVNLDLNGGALQKARYVALYAHGSHVYLAGRTVEFAFLNLWVTYRLVSTRSLDGGATWERPYYHAEAYSGEKGAALGGVGDQLYLAMEHGGAVYVAISAPDGSFPGANGYFNAGAGRWPTITALPNQEAYLLFEDAGSLRLRHYNSTGWQATETLLAGTSFDKAIYPNLKADVSGDLLEWTAARCPGATHRLMHGVRAVSGTTPPTPTPTSTPTPTPAPTETPTPPPTNTPTPTATPTPMPTSTPTPEPTATPTVTPTNTPTPTSTPPPATLHVADLDGVGATTKGGWRATVTITVRDSSGQPVAGATVSGAWSGGTSGSASCTTNSAGMCSLTSGNIGRKQMSVTFSVTGVTHTTLSYQATDNSDPDGDSNGSTITIAKP